MKILIINGSPRTKGATATVLHMMEEELPIGELRKNGKVWGLDK